MTGLEGIKPTNKHDLSKCEGCAYRSASADWCNYRDITGRSRLIDGGPLLPEGGCRLYKTGPKRKSSESPWGFYKSKETVAAIDAARREEKQRKRKRRESPFAKEIEKYYDMGLTDAKIAENVGCGHSAVKRWRDRNGLASNYKLDPQKAVENGKNLL